MSSVLLNSVSQLACQPRQRKPVATYLGKERGPVCVRREAGSLETGVSLGVSGAGVGLGVGLLDASAGAEMSLGLTHGGSSKEERVGA